MPIRRFLNGENFDPETIHVLGVALEMSCIALHGGDCADDVRQAIANKIIALAKAGERNPDALCEKALQEIRRPQPSGSPAQSAPLVSTQFDLAPQREKAIKTVRRYAVEAVR